MTIEKRIWHKRPVRKSPRVSEKETEKKHEAAKRYLFQMSEIPWEPHKKRQRTASRRVRPAEGERRNTFVEAPDQPHVRRGHKDKLKNEKKRGKRKRGCDKEHIQEQRNANAEFVDLLVLAKSAALLENRGIHNVDKPRDATDTIGSAQTKKHASHHVDKSLDTSGRIVNMQTEKDALNNFDKLLDATDRIDNAQGEKDSLHDVDKSLDASDRIGNMQAGKDVSRMKGRSHRTHFRHQALMYMASEISRSIQKDEHADLKWVEDTNIDDSANADQVEGEMCVQDVPDLCVATERGPKGLEGVRQQASLVEAVMMNPKELQPCVKHNKIIPRAVRMTTNFGDSRGQRDARLWRKDATGNMNGLLKENIPKPSQEHGHALPNCQTDPSLSHMSDAESWKQSIIMHNSELLAIQMAESLKEGPSAARQKRMQRTLERKKQRSGNSQPIVQQQGVTSCYILPRTTQMAPEHGDRREKGDVTLQLAKATTSKLNGSLQVKNLKIRQECGHAPIVLQAGVTSRYILPRTGHMEKGDVPLQLAKDSTAKLNGSLQEKNLKPQQECGHAPTVLQPGVKFRYILPRTAQMAPEHGDCMHKGDVTRQLGKDKTAKFNGFFQEKNFKTQQERGHAPIVLQPDVTSRYVFPRTARVAPEHGDHMQKGDVTGQLGKDTTAKFNGILQEKNFKTQQERGHAPIVLRPGVTSRYILPQTAQVAPEHGDHMQKGDVTRQLGKDTTAKFNGFLQEKNFKTQQERGHAPMVLQPGVTSCYILPRTAQMAPEQGDRMEKGDVTRQLGKDTTAKLNGSLQEKNLKTQQECVHARIVLQPGVTSRHILPRTAQMSPKHGDCMERSNVTRQMAKDRAAKINGSLQVNNLNSQQECGHAPFNCETEPSSKHPSAAIESRDSVALDGGNQNRPTVSQMPKSPNQNVIAHLRQMLRSVEQWTQPRQKTRENWKRKDATDFESFRATRNSECLKAQQVQGAIHLQDTQDLRTATERSPKGLEGVRKQASFVEAATTNTKELQPCVEPDKIIPWAVRMTADIVDSREQSNACIRRKDRTGNMNGSLNEYNPKTPQEHEHASPNCQIKPSLTRISNAVKVNGSLQENHLKAQQECGHAPLNCETEPSRVHLSETLESRDSVPLKDIKSDERVEAQQVRGEIHLQVAHEAPVIAKSGSDKIVDIRKQASKLDPMEGTNNNSGTCGAHQLTEDLHIATERGPKGLEGVRKQASLVEAVTTNPKELQPCVEPDKIIPRAVRMPAGIGDSREQSDACIRRKDRSGNMNDSLNEYNPKAPQEHEHAPPNCHIKPSLTWISNAVKVNGSLQEKNLKTHWISNAVKVNGSLQEKNLKTQRECGHAPLNCETEPSRIHLSETLESRDSVPLGDIKSDERVEAQQVRGEIHLQDAQEAPVIAKSGSDKIVDIRKQASKLDPMEGTNNNSGTCGAHQLTEDLHIATERGPKGLEGVRKQASLVEAVTTNPKELQPCVEPDKIIPRAVRMPAGIGDSREQSDACIRRKDRSGNMNDSLNEYNPKAPQEHEHAPPNCHIKPSLTWISNAVKVNGSLQEKNLKTHWISNAVKVNGSLQEKNLKTQRECGHAPLNCETEPSRIHLSETLESRDSVPLGDIKSDERVEAQQVRGEIHLQDAQEAPVIAKSGSDKIVDIRKQASKLDPMEGTNNNSGTCGAHQLTEDLHIATERGPKGLEGVRKQASLVEAVTTNPKELQPCVEPDKIIPRAVRMPADIGDSREQSDACIRRKNRSGNMNDSLNEYNPKAPQEHEHAPPNCHIKPSLTWISNAVKVNGSLQEKNLKTQRECGHAPLNCETEPSRIHLSETLESRDSVPLGDIKSDERVEAQQVRGEIHLQDAQEAPVIAKSGSDKIVDIRKQASKLDPMEGTNNNSGTCGAHQLTEDLCVATERGPKGLEGARKRASLVEVTNTKELQPCAEPEKIIPRQISPFLEWLQSAVRMTAANIGDSREKSDACLPTKDRTGDCMEQGDVTRQLAEDTTAKVNLEGRVSFALKDTRLDERVEAQQVRGAIHLSDTQDLCVATKMAPKGLEGVKKQASLVGAVTKNTKELQPCVERDKIIPQAVSMTANIGDSKEQSDACLRRKDRTDNMNGQLNENIPKFPQEHGHAPPNCQTGPPLTQMSDAVEDPDSDLLYFEKWKRQLLIHRSESLAIKLAELLKEGPSVARQKRMLRISERRKHRSKNSHPIVQQPRTAQMAPEHGDCMEQDDVTHQLAEDATAKVNGSLQENNLKTQEECEHAPLNCESEPSCRHLSEVLEGHDSAALEDIRSDERVEAQQVGGEIHLQDTQEPPVIGKGGFDELAAIRKQASMLDPTEVTNENPVPCDAHQLTEDASAKDGCEIISCEIRGEKRRHAENEDFAIRRGSPKRLAMGQLPEVLKEMARDKRMLRTMIRRKQRNGDICDISEPPVIGKSGFDELASIRKQASMLDPMEVTNENQLPELLKQIARDKRMLRIMVRRKQRMFRAADDINFTRTMARHQRKQRRLILLKRRYGVDIPAPAELHRSLTNGVPPPSIQGRLSTKKGVEVPATADLHGSQSTGVEVPATADLHWSQSTGVEVPAMADLHRSQTTGVDVPATADLHTSQTTSVEVPATEDLYRSQNKWCRVSLNS